MDIEEQSTKSANIPTLQPVADQNEISGHNTSFVNELKLSDFKMVLSKHSIISEFQGGVLFCGSGNVALRRHDSGRVTIEGCVSDEYYLVRDLLYQQYAIVWNYYIQLILYQPTTTYIKNPSYELER